MPKFLVSYDRHMSTHGQEFDISRETVMELATKPKREDFSHIELLLEDEFLHKHRKHLQKLLYISYKIKKVVACRHK